MPLMTCPDCARAISDRAPACPHCGWPNPEVAQAATRHSGDMPFLQSPTAQTVAQGLTIWLALKWVGKVVFAVAALAFLAYFFSRH